MNVRQSWGAALAVALALLAAPSLGAGEPVLADRALGKPDAPITMHEYASLTCSHCADFTAKVFPEIQKRYIDTGKVRYVFHDFPMDGVGLKASTLARCMPAEQYYPFVGVVFKNLQQWAYGKDPEQTLIQYAKLGGLSDEKAKACLKDTKLIEAIAESRIEAEKKYDIDSTPTFIINGGKEKIVGARKIEEFAAVFDRLLAAKK